MRALSWFFGIPNDEQKPMQPQNRDSAVKPLFDLGLDFSTVVETVEDPFSSSNHKRYFEYLVDCYSSVELADLESTLRQGEGPPFRLMLQDVFVPPLLVLAPDLANEPHLSHMYLNKWAQGEPNIWKLVLQAVPCVVITGSPGSGKTSLLKYMTLNLAEKREAHGVPNKLPLLLFLRNHNKAITQNPNYTLAEAANNSISYNMLEPLSFDWFEMHLRAGECLVMLDGLDEVADATERERVATWVEQQIDAYPNNHFVVTSRPLSYRSNLISGAKVLEIQPFNKEQKQRFIEGWYLANQINNGSLEETGSLSAPAGRTAEEEIEELTRLCSEPPWSALAMNPLLLTMIATQQRHGASLATDRGQLYAQVCHLLLDSSEPYLGFDLTSKQKLRVLEPLAYHMVKHKQNEIEPEEANRVIYVTLDIVTRNPKGYEFLRMIADTSVLLSQQDNGNYRFVHQTIQEYLAAMYIHDYRLGHQLIKHVQDSWWHETICLYSNIVDATPIIAACLDQSPLTVAPLSLACRCVEQAHQIQPEWENKLERGLEERVEDPDPMIRRIAAEGLLSFRLARMVPVNNNLYVAESLITNAEYQLFIHAQRRGKFQSTHWLQHTFHPGDSLKPVIGVRPSEAVAFCDWLTARDKKARSYRLPYSGEFRPLHTKVGYWTQGQKEQVYKLENEQPVVLSISALEHRLRSVLIRDLSCNPDEALDRVRDLARDLEYLLERDNEDVRSLALILARDLAHERAHNRALNINQTMSVAPEDTIWYTHFVSWLVTQQLVTILRQQPKPRSWLDAFDRHQIPEPANTEQANSLAEEYFELYVDLANLEENNQAKLLASRGIRIVARTPLTANTPAVAFKADPVNKEKVARLPAFIPSTSPTVSPNPSTLRPFDKLRAPQAQGTAGSGHRMVHTERKVIQKKICLLGDEGVGKTSLVRRYVEGRFDEKYLSTMGVSISRKTLVSESYAMNLLVWDMEGAAGLKKVQVNYLRGAAGALIVCDLTRRETLGAFERFAHQLRALNKNVPFVLIGNKVDLKDRGIRGPELEKISLRLNAPYLLTSAKTGTQVNQAFKILADLIERQQK